MSSNTPLSILHVIMGFKPLVGGAEKQAEILSEAQLKNNKVFIFTRVAPGTKKNEENNELVIKRFGWYNIFGSKEITSFIIAVKIFFDRSKFDVIQVHQSHVLASAVAFICAKINKPCFIKVANSGNKFDLKILSERLFIGSFFLKLLIKSKPIFIAITPRIKNELLSYGVDNKYIKEIPNGVKIPYSQKRNQTVFNNKNIIFLARLEKVKRPMLFVKISEFYKDLNVYFHMYGDGNLRGELETYIKKNEIDNCFLHGKISDVDKVLMESKLLILPSETEGMSNSILEALSNGIPIIASDIEQNRFLIKDKNEAAILVRSSRPIDWKLKIDKLLYDKNLYNKYSNGALKLVKNYEISKVAERYLKLYRDNL